MKIRLKPISEQTIVITGASSGIGLTTARMAADLSGTIFALVAIYAFNMQRKQH